MTDYNDLVDSLIWLLRNRIQQKLPYTHGVLGDGNDRVRVPGEPDYVYARPDRFSQKTFTVFNKRINGQDGDPIIIGKLPWEPDLVQVIDFDWETYRQVGWGDNVAQLPRHGRTHEWRDGAPGIDTFNVYRRQLGDLKAYPSPSGTVAVDVSAYSISLYEQQKQFPGVVNFPLSGAVPSSTGTARMALVYWDPASGTSGYLGVATGTLGLDADPFVLNRPATPPGTVPIVFARLAGGQSSITEFDLWDAREPFRPGIRFGTGSAALHAGLIPILNAGGYFTGTSVDAALEELGALSGAIVKNTSGAVANPGDVGYINGDNEYKTTTTQFLDAEWCVVVRGGVTDDDIYVARRGVVTVKLNGNCSVGDKLYTSTTATQAEPQSYMRPEMFAIARTANSDGAGGTCEALLYTDTRQVYVALDDELFGSPSASRYSDLDWTGTIAELPGGAAVRYSTSSGTEDNLKPTSTGTKAKMRLYNSTQGEYALISDNDPTGGAGPPAFDGEITLTANVPGTWSTSDTITIKSQTNTSTVQGGAAFFCDLEVTSSDVPELTRFMSVDLQINDTTATNEQLTPHPWESNTASKRDPLRVYVTNHTSDKLSVIPLFQRRFCLAWSGGGSSTVFVNLRVRVCHVASP